MSDDRLSGMESLTLSSTAELRRLFDHIERQLKLGYTHKQICVHLNSRGLNISYGYYRVVMTRLRGERKAGGANAGSLAPIPAQDGKSGISHVIGPNECELNGALSSQVAAPLNNIEKVPDSAPSRRWKGKDILKRDWSKF